MMRLREVRVKKVRFSVFSPLLAVSPCILSYRSLLASSPSGLLSCCVPGSDEEEKKEVKDEWSSGRIFMEEFDAPFSCRLSLKDFDRLILDLDRELAKQINICL